MKVKQLMSKNLITIHVNSCLRNARRLMRKHGISRLLVRDGDKIVGIITERDIAERLGSWKERKLSDARIFVSSTLSSKLIKVSQEQDIKAAARQMLEKGISSLVVEDGNIVGILTKTDLIKALANSNALVRDWMSRPVITIGIGASILHARLLMLRNGIKRLPVMVGNRIVGMVTERDIACALGLFRKISEGKQWDERMKKILVEQVMSRDVITVVPTATLAEVVKIMLKKGISGLPVVENERLIGIITKTDLVRAVAEGQF